MIWHPLSLLWQETLALPTVGQGSSDWGIPHTGQGDSRAGVVGAAGQAPGSRPQPGVNAHRSGRALLPPKQLHLLHLLSSSNPRCAAQRGLSQSLERCPSDKPCSELVSRCAPHAAPASVCPSPFQKKKYSESLSSLTHPHHPQCNFWPYASTHTHHVPVKTPTYPVGTDYVHTQIQTGRRNLG